VPRLEVAGGECLNLCAALVALILRKKAIYTRGASHVAGAHRAFILYTSLIFKSHECLSAAQQSKKGAALSAALSKTEFECRAFAFSLAKGGRP